MQRLARLGKRNKCCVTKGVRSASKLGENGNAAWMVNYESNHVLRESRHVVGCVGYGFGDRGFLFDG